MSRLKVIRCLIPCSSINCFDTWIATHCEGTGPAGKLPKHTERPCRMSRCESFLMLPAKPNRPIKCLENNACFMNTKEWNRMNMLGFLIAFASLPICSWEGSGHMDPASGSSVVLREKNEMNLANHVDGLNGQGCVCGCNKEIQKSAAVWLSLWGRIPSLSGATFLLLLPSVQTIHVGWFLRANCCGWNAVSSLTCQSQSLHCKSL